MTETIYTVGHSNHPMEHFCGLLDRHGITAVCDVRSKPYSRMNPQFNREPLRRMLKGRGIAYVFLGLELGARSEDDSCYAGGKVQYDRLARTELFRSGLQRLRNGAREYRLALMCAEKDPIECHRTILVARQLEAAGFEIRHILADGRTETQGQALGRVMRLLGLSAEDMFRPRESIEADAYRLQGERIAYTRDAAGYGEGERGVAG